MRKKQPQIVLQRKGRAELERLLRREHCSEDRQAREDCAHERRWPWRHGDHARGRSFEKTVWRWQEYFVEAGVGGLIKGRTKPAGKKPISAAIKLKIVEKTVKEHPAAATHWSVRTMAEEMGV